MVSGRDKVVKLLIENDADFSIKNTDGKTAVDIAEDEGNYDLNKKFDSIFIQAM